MNEAILHWLKSKTNYVYYDFKNDNFSDFLTREIKIRKSSKISDKDLKASKCYLIESRENGLIDTTLFYPDNHKYSYTNYNSIIFSHVANIVRLNIVVNKLNENTNKNTQLKYLLEIIYLVKHEKEYKFKNKFKIDLNSMFENISISNLEEINNKLSQENIDFSKENIDIIKNEISKYRNYFKKKEIGIFHPFLTDKNPLEKNHYLFEIDIFKFSKRNTDYKMIFENYYDSFCFTSNTFKMKEYFSYSGLKFDPYFAYFDPIEHYEKFKGFYRQKEIKENYNTIFVLLNFLNIFQMEVVVNQQELLALKLSNKRSNNRQYSIQERIDNDIYDFDKQADSKIDDSVLKLTDEELILEIKKKYSTDFMNKLSIENTINVYKKLLRVLSRQYNISKESEKTITDMLLDIANNYSVKNRNKIFNTIYESLYKKYTKRDLFYHIDFELEEALASDLSKILEKRAFDIQRS